MKLLVDQSDERIEGLMGRYPFIAGQLQTPLSRYRLRPGVFAVDNGAFAGKAGPAELHHLLARLRPSMDNCLWVACPDVVGSARRTLEVFERLATWLQPWPVALVCQDGQENLPIQWDSIAAVFIGGSTEWKMSDPVAHIIRAAQLLGKRTHVGRVNTPDRWAHFARLGVDTCDGTGASRYDWMLDAIAASLAPRPLLVEESCTGL
jgi:hypothetical protein